MAASGEALERSTRRGPLDTQRLAGRLATPLRLIKKKKKNRRAPPSPAGWRVPPRSSHLGSSPDWPGLLDEIYDGLDGMVIPHAEAAALEQKMGNMTGTHLEPKQPGTRGGGCGEATYGEVMCRSA